MNVSILLIDDDPLVLESLTTVLVDLGFAVITARDGKEGIRLFEAQAPDLVLTDVIMPLQDGLETIREIRRLSPGAKIVAMSGGGRIARGEVLKMAALLGADQVIAKPFEASEVLEAIVRCFAGDPREHLLGRSSQP